jgi:antitoxin CptB
VTATVPASDGAAAAIDPATARRLQWRCRRGMRELDRLFDRRLQQLLAAADGPALARFERLLDCEDDRLWRWCLGHERPDDPGLAIEIDALRADTQA